MSGRAERLPRDGRLPGPAGRAHPGVRRQNAACRRPRPAPPAVASVPERPLRYRARLAKARPARPAAGTPARRTPVGLSGSPKSGVVPLGSQSPVSVTGPVPFPTPGCLCYYSHDLSYSRPPSAHRARCLPSRAIADLPKPAQASLPEQPCLSPCPCCFCVKTS